MGASLKLPFWGNKNKNGSERQSHDDVISRPAAFKDDKAFKGDKQYSVEEAVAVNKKLKDVFADDLCQKQLKIAEAIYPCRGQRGHPDAAKFTAKLHELMLQSFRGVLPEPGWDGYRRMVRRMASVADDPRVVRSREEMHAVLGIPRSFVFRPPAEEPLYEHRPDGSGASGCPLGGPALTDDDGDVANEFWEETPSGELRRVDARPCADARGGVQASAQSAVDASAATAPGRDVRGAAGQASATAQAADGAAAGGGKRKSKHKHKR